ncbi:MAG: hypothetical protein RLZZ387_3224 [Chloroflexota bacterium]
MRWFGRRPADLPDTVRAYLEAAEPEARLPWREAPYTVLDVETTGLDARADALLAIGLVDVERGQVLLESCWRTLVRPPADAPLRPDAIAVTGLLRGDTSEAPEEDEVLPALLRRLAGRVLVVHVAAVDVAFLNQALRRRYGVRLRGPTIDTARLATRLHHSARLMGGGDEPPAIQLRALCTSLGLPTYAEHDALSDAITTAQLFLAQATRLEAQGRRTLGGLLR